MKGEKNCTCALHNNFALALERVACQFQLNAHKLPLTYRLLHYRLTSSLKDLVRILQQLLFTTATDLNCQTSAFKFSKQIDRIALNANAIVSFG